MDYRIVPITEEHIEGFHATLGSVARERKYLGFLEAPALDATRAFVVENIQEGQPAFVALSDALVIGWCDISTLGRPIYAHAGVLGMGVLREYRGRGVGRALIQATLDRARAIGLTRVELTVRARNERAIALYEKIGFRTEGVKRNAVRVDGHYEDLLCMAVLFEASTTSSVVNP